MKKFVALSFLSILLLAFASIVCGQEKAPTLEFKASGWMDVISIYSRNVTNTDGGIYNVDTNDNAFFGPIYSAKFTPGDPAAVQAFNRT